VSFELGLHLGNAHPTATAASVTDLAVAAEQQGFAAVYMTEHVVVESDVGHRYGNVIHPLSALAFLAARTTALRLATSVIVAPLHDPYLLAKLAGEIQELSHGRLRLGLGAGWYEPEFALMGRPFAGRGQRLDQQIALMQALWSGRHGGVRFGPAPTLAPEIWIGGKSEWAAARAKRLRATWHPIELTAEDIARARERNPDLHIVPRVTTDDVATLAREIEAMREAGADGVAAGLTIGPERTRDALPDLARSVN
jgi:alkanesulfonate monooxygenase SsuD/methylene tetrahydromethanopterin reductase-like flavin-dependent oxidoreductase (luciferase family)